MVKLSLKYYEGHMMTLKNLKHAIDSLKENRSRYMPAPADGISKLSKLYIHFTAKSLLL